LVNQQRVDHATNFDQLLPLTTVSGKTRYFAGRHGADLAETDVGYHPLESRTRHRAGGRSAQVFVDHFNFLPPESTQSLPHGVLQLATLLVVNDLIGRRLANIQDGLPLEMLWLDFLTYRTPPPRCRLQGVGSDALVADEPADSPLSDRCRREAPPTTASSEAGEIDSVVFRDDKFDSFASVSPFEKRLGY